MPGSPAGTIAFLVFGTQFRLYVQSCGFYN
jgi:hypothetical protein